jgi:hypothetical protein
MAEELIYCPSCNQKVRVPEEMLGQTVQCPLCRLVFTAPVRGGEPAPPPLVQAPPSVAPPPGDDLYSPYQAEAAIGLVRAPGIALMIAAILALLLNVYRLVKLSTMGVDGLAQELQEQEELWKQLGISLQQGLPTSTLYTAEIVALCIFLVLDLGMLVGGVQMLNARSYGLALTGGIFAILSALNCPCCLLSFPFGIWALVVLLRPDVRSLFGR